MIIREKVRIGDQVVTLETGRIAKQAGGSCLVRAGDTVVLVTVCGNREPKAGQNFFPLSVDYIEKTYAAGKIPGGFFKREGKLRDYEVLTSRLIDRPCRPLFPEGYMADVQIVATVMSFDQENPADTLAILGASAALHISEIPWSGPLGGVRIGRIDGQFIANPTYKQMEKSDCELILAASRDAIVMVEGEADEMSEEDMIEALFFGHRAIQDSLDLVDRMRAAVGKPKWSFSADTTPSYIKDRVSQVGGYKVREACNIADKHARYDRFKQIKKEIVETLAGELPGNEELVKKAYEDLHYKTLRDQVLDEGRRVDGRDTKTVRPISIELGVLPRTHGSTLFTRGETQAIVTTTLGTSRDEQRIDMLTGDIHKNFLLHYNFPPYSVGEVKMMRGVGRREVGHGNLAERALAKMIPAKAAFPYTIRLVSEITESNGSSSMASVCGGSLALMDAGVPIKSPVAGVAMGLIKEGERYAVLTDILGDEDHLGDMDFKVCGTERGVTAIQMDIKIDGLSREILERALHQAREGRLFILDKMRQALSTARVDLSRWAPRITQIRVKPDQVRTIIGPGGKMIRAIVDQTGASIDVEDDGTVNVSSADSAAVLKALEIIKSLTTEPEIGEIYEGTVKRIEPYGAFIEILPGKDGLCHISDIDASHVQSVEDFMNLGDKVSVKITNIDRDGRIRLSRKEAIGDAGGAKLNGRAEPREERPAAMREERPAREERPRLREDRPVREERPAMREERPAREERPRLREDRPVREERPAFRDEKPVREERPAFRDEKPVREERPAFRDEKPVREERPAFRDDKPAREERPAFRDDKPAREERPAFRDERPARSERPLRDERPSARVRDDKPMRDERPSREERPQFRDDERPARVRDVEPAHVREDKPLRDERPRFRDEERPARGREIEPARVRDDKPVRDERPAPRRDFDRDERPVVKTRDFDREPARVREDKPVRDERPAPRRDFDRDERPVVKTRDFDREPARVREDKPVRDERPAPRRDFDRDERPVVKTRDFDREPARVRDDKPVRDERPAPRRDFDRDERPVVKTRDFDREPARVREDKPVRDERPAPRRDFDRDERPAQRRDFDRDERPVAKTRDFDRDERPVAKTRDFDRDERPVAKTRDFDRDERPVAKTRDFDRDERPALRRDSEIVDRRPARRDGVEEPRDVRRERPDDRFDTRAPREEDIADSKTGLVRDREDRTERERPSRTRARARTRDRVREDERERR